MYWRTSVRIEILKAAISLGMGVVFPGEVDVSLRLVVIKYEEFN
jgi:hypothetical protein